MSQPSGRASGPMRVGVLVSGFGSNLQALLDRFNLGDDSWARVAIVVGSRSGIGALDRARAAAVPVAIVPPGPDSPAHPEADAAYLLERLEAAGVELVVLAGYLRLIPQEVVRTYWGRMINIHPALLPSFGGQGLYGRRVHEAVLATGCRVTGVTIHFVSEEYDRGPIVAQWPVPVFEDDDVPALAARVLRVEHRLLPSVVHAVARGWVSLTKEDRCVWCRPLYGQDRFSMPMDGAIPAPVAEPSAP